MELARSFIFINNSMGNINVNIEWKDGSESMELYSMMQGVPRLEGVKDGEELTVTVAADFSRSYKLSSKGNQWVADVNPRNIVEWHPM